MSLVGVPTATADTLTGAVGAPARVASRSSVAVMVALVTPATMYERLFWCEPPEIAESPEAPNSPVLGMNSMSPIEGLTDQAVLVVMTTLLPEAARAMVPARPTEVRRS